MSNTFAAVFRFEESFIYLWKGPSLKYNFWIILSICQSSDSYLHTFRSSSVSYDEFSPCALYMQQNTSLRKMSQTVKFQIFDPRLSLHIAWRTTPVIFSNNIAPKLEISAVTALADTVIEK